MSKTDLGKSWETVFRRSWEKQFPGTFIHRLPDQMSGYRETSGNPCDFLCYPGYCGLFMVECKEHLGASIPFTAIPQYERLLKYKGRKNVYPGCIIWFSEKDKIIWVDIDEMEKMVNDGEKSIGLRMLKEGLYNIIEIPGEKKRVFIEPDLHYLINLKDGGQD